MEGLERRFLAVQLVFRHDVPGRCQSDALGHGDFIHVERQATKAPLHGRICEHKGHRAPFGRAAVLPSVEDQIFRVLSAEGLG